MRAVKAGWSSIVASVKKSAGEGKNALLTLLGLGAVKLAVVTDHDVDIFDQEELEWAMAYRVQADRDVMVVPGARGKHLDPSTRAWELPKGELPMTAKLGIDATIPEGIPAEKYEHQQYAFEGHLSGPATGPADVPALVRRIEQRLQREPAFFLDVVEALDGVPYRDVLRAWGLVRERTALRRDGEGRYLPPGEADRA